MSDLQPFEDPSKSRAERIASLNYDYAAQPKEFQSTCNLCGADNWTVITHRDRYNFPAQTTSCTQCGLTMLNPRMTFEGYIDFYTSVYRPLVSAYHGRRIDAKNVQEEQWVYADEMEAFIRPYCENRPGMSFLDVGGSTGVISKHFIQAFDMKPTVLDPAPDEIVEADAMGIKTITALVEDWDPEGIKYDVIGMFQTIDHLLDVKVTLTKLREAIADDGYFVVDIVDYRAAYLKNWSAELATKIDHPFSLTESTTEAYLAQAGFSVIRRSYSRDHHLVMYICKPVEPNPNALPDPSDVKEFFQELRYVQNAPKPAVPAS